MIIPRPFPCRWNNALSQPTQNMELVINFSGGKDSTAMLSYICDRYPDVKKHCVFADTGWEHTDAEEWSRDITSRFDMPLHVVRNPNKDFFSMIRHRGKFPSPDNRQCTSDLKRGPIQTWIRRNISDPVVINCMGLRAEESPARAKKSPLTRNKTMTNSRRTVWDWLPIHDWTETQVRGYLKHKDLPLHPVYNYLNRFSCQVCIYMTQHDLRAVKANNPAAFERIAALEREIGFTMQYGQSIDEKILPIL